MDSSKKNVTVPADRSVPEISADQVDEVVSAARPDAEIKVLRSNRTRNPFMVSFLDFAEGVRLWRLWSTLGYLEVKRRYRRTVLGPFWATGHIAVYVLCVGFIFSSVLGADRRDYVVFLVSGFIPWYLVYLTINDSVGAFTSSSSLRQQIAFPYSMFIFTAIWRNLIVHFHNYTLWMVVSLFYLYAPTWKLLLLFPGYLLVLGNMVWICTLLALLAARFRDVTQLVAAVVQIMIFVTPIFWSIDMMDAYKRIYVVGPNLLYHLTVVLRSPLLGEVPPLSSYAVLVFTLFAGYTLVGYYFGKFRHRIIFWIL